MYLSNGLKVVSINIPAIASSAVSDNIFFYEEQSPRKIANAILDASQQEIYNTTVLSKLDKKFERELRDMLG